MPAASVAPYVGHGRLARKELTRHTSPYRLAAVAASEAPLSRLGPDAKLRRLMSLHDRLSAITNVFAVELLRAVRTAPIEELAVIEELATKPKNAPRRETPSSKRIAPVRARGAAQHAAIRTDAATVQKHLRTFLLTKPQGASAGEICAALDLGRGSFNRHLKVARDAGSVRMKGMRSTARYLATP